MRIRNDMRIQRTAYGNPFRYGSDRRRLYATHEIQNQLVGEWTAARVADGWDRGVLTNYLRYASNRRAIQLLSHGVPVQATVRPQAQAPVLRDYAPVPAADPATYLPTFGVEIELVLPAGMNQSALAAAITAGGVVCNAEGYNHYTGANWKIVSDASVGYDGCEVVSPPLLGDAGFEAVKKVSEVLVNVGCTIKKKCGLHVHVNARGLGLDFFRRLVALYATNEDLLDAIQPQSRRANVYCATVKNFRQVSDQTSVPVACETIIEGRYRKVNLASYARHKTVEFRQHSGTVESAKILPWVRLCLAMCAFARGTEVIPAAPSLTSFLTSMGSSKEEMEHFEMRRVRFAVAEQRRAA